MFDLDYDIVAGTPALREAFRRIFLAALAEAGVDVAAVAAVEIRRGSIVVTVYWTTSSALEQAAALLVDGTLAVTVDGQTVPATSPVESSPAASTSSSSSLGGGAIAGIIIGCLLGVAIIGLLIYKRDEIHLKRPHVSLPSVQFPSLFVAREKHAPMHQVRKLLVHTVCAACAVDLTC